MLTSVCSSAISSSEDGIEGIGPRTGVEGGNGDGQRGPFGRRSDEFREADLDARGGESGSVRLPGEVDCGRGVVER